MMVTFGKMLSVYPIALKRTLQHPFFFWRRIDGQRRRIHGKQLIDNIGIRSCVRFFSNRSRTAQTQNGHMENQPYCLRRLAPGWAQLNIYNNKHTISIHPKRWYAYNGEHGTFNAVF
jgi:hypothetical protein